MRRLHHGILSLNARPQPQRIIRTKKSIKIDTITEHLSDLYLLNQPKICIIRRLGGIGDVVMTTPILRHIKRMLPGCELSYATDLKYADGALGDILKYNPYIDCLVDYRHITEKAFNYSADVTQTGLFREKPQTIPPNRIDMFAERVGIDLGNDTLPDYYVTKEETLWAKNQLKDLEKKETKFVAIHARSNDARRTWPLDYTDKLLKLLSETNGIHPIVFDWANDHQWNKNHTTIFLGIKIRQAMAIINECECLICPDSGLLHLAGALEKKIVSIFGTTPPESRINHYQNATAIVTDLPCRPCFYKPSCLKSGNNKLQCFINIKPETVYKATMNKIAEDFKTKKSFIQQVISDSSGKIIIVKRRYGGYGDIIMSTTGIETLAKKYPNAEIHYALPKEYFLAVENNPIIKKLIDINTLNIKTCSGKIIIDISSPCAYYESSRIRMRKKVEKSRVEIFAEALGVRGYLEDLKPKYYTTKKEITWAKKFLGKSDKPLIGLVLKTAEKYRNWPIENYYKLAKKLKEDVKLVIIDLERGYDFKDTINACGFPFRKSAAIVSQCDLIVTPDTSHLHVAAALNIPTVALFGPIDSQARCKGYSNTTVITSEIDCEPCWRNRNIPCKQTKSTQEYSECMKKITVNKVYKAVIELLEIRNDN